VLLSGLPGSGKTTFARRLLARLPPPARHLESDAIRRLLFTRPAYTPEESARVFHEIGRQAEAALAEREYVIVDATNLTERDRRRFYALAARLAVPLVAVRVVAPERTIRERLERPREGFSEAGVEVFEEMRARPEPLRVPTIVVDTRYDLEPSVELVARLLKAETE